MSDALPPGQGTQWVSDRCVVADKQTLSTIRVANYKDRSLCGYLTENDLHTNKAEALLLRDPQPKLKPTQRRNHCHGRNTNRS